MHVFGHAFPGSGACKRSQVIISASFPCISTSFSSSFTSFCALLPLASYSSFSSPLFPPAPFFNQCSCCFSAARCYICCKCCSNFTVPNPVLIFMFCPFVLLFPPNSFCLSCLLLYSTCPCYYYSSCIFLLLYASVCSIVFIFIPLLSLIVLAPLFTVTSTQFFCCLSSFFCRLPC